MLMGIIIDPKEHLEIRKTSVTFLCSFASNPATHQILREHRAVDVFIYVMKSNDVSLMCTSAALAVANICDRKGDFTELAAGCSDSLLCKLIDALRATLQGQDYPANTNGFYTDWKLVMGIGFMCRHPPARAVIKHLGLADLLRTALVSETSSTKLLKYCLETLWLLSVD
eukprot:c8967_g2_i4.p2 GENE.c8967_g2_i4~~c8967_g2_i4.p2  ORF type:complete len:170 (+),score=28.34 c8967_g2_i4:519-1028(+)